MIIGNCFDGDDNEELILYQHECYENAIRYWINVAGKRRLHYGRLPEWEEISRHWEAFRKYGYHDHRCIQAHHDLIAKRFRIIQKTPDHYFGTILGKKGWCVFFEREITTFMKDPDMLRLFMSAVVHRNTTAGYDAEDALLYKMNEKYCIVVVPSVISS